MQAIGTARGNPNSAKAKSTYSNKIFRPEYQNEHTAVEMTGKDRPGLFSEISAALADLHCNIVEAHAWSHNDRLACVAYISDRESSGTPIDDPDRLATIEDHLSTVLRATSTIPPSLIGSIQTNQQEVKAGFLEGSEEGTNTTNVERRLHQLMHSVRDFEVPSAPATSLQPTMTQTTESEESDDEGRKTVVKIERCDQKRYSIVNIECKDRPRLMFDTVCTLTDMQYVIFHASISSDRGYAFQVCMISLSLSRYYCASNNISSCKKLINLSYPAS